MRSALVRMRSALIFVCVARGILAESPEELINIRQGTYGMYQLSTGNTLPLVGIPWGHTHWAPQTQSDHTGSWWFNNDIPKLAGVRMTHQPSPWISEWGTMTVQMGYEDEGWDRSQPYDLEADETYWSPYHFGADILGMATDEGNARIDLSASSRGAIIRIRWPTFDEDTGYPQKRYVRFSVPDADDLNATASGSVAMFTGGTKSLSSSSSVGNLDEYTMFFDGRLEGGEPEQVEVVMSIPDPDDPTTPPPVQIGCRAWYPTSVTEIVVRVGVSLISQEAAASHREREVPSSKTFDDFVAENKAIWKEKLSVIDITKTGFESNAAHNDELLKTFWSSFYHAMMFPRNLGEPIDGVEKHWSPYSPSGGIFDGPVTTDSGFWDSYHTMYTFLQLFYPEQLGVILEGYVNAYNEGGWLPQWGSPGYRGSMVGTMSDVSFADSIVKGFGGFDITGALQAMKTNAYDPPDEGGRGRRGLPDYKELGYIPRGSKDEVGEVHEPLSRTMNHAFADWAIARAAKAVEGQDVFTAEEIADLEKRGGNWKNVFDPDVGFFRVKDAEGNFIEGFDQYVWGGDLTEGGPWQFRFYAPHDPLGMAALFGGAEKMCEKLEESNSHPSYVHRGPNNYGSVIHEMLEMPIHNWGQNSHNNQPSHHYTYMFMGAYDSDEGLYEKCNVRGQHWLRETMLHAYNSTHFTGDEDNGEMGAWLVLSALGLYDLAPGSGEYTLGIPLFEEVKVKMLGSDKVVKGSNCNAKVFHGEMDSKDCAVGVVRTLKDGSTAKDLTRAWRAPFADLKDADTLEFDFGEFKFPPEPESPSGATQQGLCALAVLLAAAVVA